MPHLRKLSAAGCAQAAHRRELARQQEVYLVTLDDENPTTPPSATLEDGNAGAVLSVSGLSVKVLDKDGNLKSELGLEHIDPNSALYKGNEQEQPIMHEKTFIAEKIHHGITARDPKPLPPPPADIPLHSMKAKTKRMKISSDLKDRYSPSASAASKVSPRNTRTLQELAELRAKKLAKFIQTQFSTMAERNAAVKAAEEAIYAQLVARQSASAEFTKSEKYHNRSLEDVLGMIDQIYLKIRQQEDEQRQKYREYKEGAMHEHAYVETTPRVVDKSKIIPSQFRGAASVDPDSCSAAMGGGGIGEVDERALHVKVPVIAEKIDSQIANAAREAGKADGKSPQSDSFSNGEASVRVEIPDVSLYGDHVKNSRMVDGNNDGNKAGFAFSATDSGSKLSIRSLASIPSSESPRLHPSPHSKATSFECKVVSLCEHPEDPKKGSDLLDEQDQDKAIRRAEEMVRLMAQEVDWLLTSNGDESSVASSVDFEDDISILSQYTRTSLRSLTETPRSPRPLKIVVKREEARQQWLSYWNDEHQREYYYNPRSKEVVWRIPDEDDILFERETGDFVVDSSFRYDDGTVDYSDVVPAKDFTKISKTQCQIEEVFRNRISPEHLSSAPHSQRSQKSRAVFATLFATIFLFALTLRHSFSRCPKQLQFLCQIKNDLIKRPSLVRSCKQTSILNVQSDNQKNKNDVIFPSAVDFSQKYIFREGDCALVDAAKSIDMTSPSLGSLHDNYGKELQLSPVKSNKLVSDISKKKQREKSLTLNAEEERESDDRIVRELVPEGKRRKECYVPLAWVIFPNCRKQAPFFDVDSPEFMKYW